MDSTIKERDSNPGEGANPVSSLFFWWTRKFFKLCYKRIPKEDELYSPLTVDMSNVLGNRLQKQWNKELKKESPRLVKAIFNTFRSDLVNMLFLQFVNLSFRFAQPVLLGKLLEYFNEGNNENEFLVYAGILTSIVCLNAFLTHHFLYYGAHVGMQMRVACCSLIYRKALYLSQDTLQDTVAGNIVNLMSNDVSRFDRLLQYVHYVLLVPFLVVAVAFQLWKSVGLAGVIGVTCVAVLMVMQACMGKLFSLLRLKAAEKTDVRIRLMDEIISAVQVIKMYAWEKCFSDMVAKVRRGEINIIGKSRLLNGIFTTIQLTISRLGLLIAITALVLLGGHLSPTNVFVMFSFFSVLAAPGAIAFVTGIMDSVETLVSIKRLQAFLLTKEIKSVTQDKMVNEEVIPEVHVIMENVTAGWSGDNTLNNITFSAGEGQLIAVIGSVGAGKSSLLQTILGELPVSSGKCSVHGKVSYASQDPWIFGATVRQNIVFDSSFDKERYKNVLNVCALQRDLNQFPHGDLTIVGEKGISLSGGQKARINLARAVYNNADVYLLDDPLSAVDSRVAQHLFAECISSYLKKKTRILVTHQLQFLQSADRIIVLNNGEIDMQGSYEEITSNQAYSKLLGLCSDLREKREEGVKRKLSHLEREISRQSMQYDDDMQYPDEEQGLVPETTIYKGSVAIQYFRAGANVFTIIFTLVLFVIAQIAASCGDFWLSHWAVEEQEVSHQQFVADTNVYSDTALMKNYYSYNTSSGYSKSYQTPKCLYTYIGLVLSQFFGNILATFCLLHMCGSSSKLLHNVMFNSVIRTRLQFFSTNPSGRILNRFSKDLGSVDELLPRGIHFTLQILMLLLGAMILVAYLHYIMLIPMVALCCLFIFLCRLYVMVSIQIKRLEGITKSPVLTHVNATLQGLATVRAHEAQLALAREFDKKQDVHSSAWFTFIAMRSACTFYVDFICFLYIAMITFFTPFIGQDEFGGKAGLAISQSMGVAVLMQFGMQQFVEVSSAMVSAERIMEYTQLEEEPSLESTPDKESPSDWPTAGSIEFEHTYLKYSETGPYVLKDLNIVIYPTEKVGIVGRTGAGKSSLIATLFRLAWIEGSVKVDEVDTKHIALQDLRRNISIIPQDPVLFSGTIRRNLDPFEEFSDDVLWRTLEEVELKEAVGSLDMKVAEGGSNFSVGQRQLMCLARAILRNNKILILDEATANVDPHTDYLIQKKVREKFENCTVLTIAHRLNTIMDSCKVLVIEAGNVMEFDHPHILLLKRGGHFWKMVQKTGRAMSRQLHLIAENNYELTATRL